MSKKCFVDTGAKNEWCRDLIMLPLEIYHLIAAQSEGTYKALLALPPFARDIDVSKRYDYMVAFGHSVDITPHSIGWHRKNVLHRLGGPALECTNGTNLWFRNNILHRDDGPAVVCCDGAVEWFINGKRV